MCLLEYLHVLATRGGALHFLLAFSSLSFFLFFSYLLYFCFSSEFCQLVGAAVATVAATVAAAVVHLLLLLLLYFLLHVAVVGCCCRVLLSGVVVVVVVVWCCCCCLCQMHLRFNSLNRENQLGRCVGDSLCVCVCVGVLRVPVYLSVCRLLLCHVLQFS